MPAAALLSTLLLCAGSLLPAAIAAQTDEASLFVLVRHAEKVDDSRDAKLSAAGEKRAQALARLLADMELNAVFTTDFRRTRDTAQPVARHFGVELTVYDGADIAGFAASLRESSTRALVVGHSNTTPALVRALGGDPGSAIDEYEYDRVYIVVVRGGETTTALLRFSP